MGRYAQAKRRGGGRGGVSLNYVVSVHKTAFDTATFVFNQPTDCIVGAVVANPNIRINSQVVAITTNVNPYTWSFQFAGSLSVGFPAVILGPPPWMTGDLRPGTITLT
jgi:hypothetical protein